LSALFRADDAALIADLFDGGSAFLHPAAILEALTPEQATARPHGLPHSIAEIVAHICFWQEWFNGCLTAGYKGLPQHAAEGWPAVSAADWEVLRARYLSAVAEAKHLAASSDRLNEPLLPAGIENPFLQRDSFGSGILHGAFHTSHHLGQIVTIRQLLGAWPPPAGSMTW